MRSDSIITIITIINTTVINNIISSAINIINIVIIIIMHVDVRGFAAVNKGSALYMAAKAHYSA